MRMNDFLHGFLKAEDIEPNVKLEDVVADVKTVDFEEKGETISKPVISLGSGAQIVLNQTRLRSMIRGFGPNSDNWCDKTILISRGTTTYSGKDVPCIRIEPVVPAQIAAPPPKGRGKMTITSGKAKAPATETAPPIDDIIPF